MSAQINDIKQPFEKQKKQNIDNTAPLPLYDGFILQRLFGYMLSDDEASIEHLHIILTDLLTCTFNEDDWRYHARAVICGTPSIVSLTGIVEAPAKPNEFYIRQFGGLVDINTLKSQFAGKFIDYGDNRLAEVATGYVLQSIFFFIADGEPFCDDNSCRLFNAHWQEDLIYAQLIARNFCEKHERMLNQLND
jgi:hypothetical protein